MRTTFLSRWSIATVAVLIGAVLSAQPLMAKYTGFYWTQANRTTGDPQTQMVFDYLDDAEITPGSLIVVEYGWDNQAFNSIGNKAVAKNLTVMMALPVFPGQMFTDPASIQAFSNTIASYKTQIPSHLYGRIGSVALGEEFYSVGWKSGHFCTYGNGGTELQPVPWPEFADLCQAGMPISHPSNAYLIAGIQRIYNFLSLSGHPALKQHFGGKYVTMVENFFNNDQTYPATAPIGTAWHPVPLQTDYLTMDKYVDLPTLSFDQAVVPFVQHALSTIGQSIMLVGHAFYGNVPANPVPSSWPPNFGPTAPVYQAHHNYCFTQVGATNVFQYNMCRYAYLAAVEPKIVGLIWFSYGSPGGLKSTSPYDMAAERALAVAFNATLRSY